MQVSEALNPPVLEPHEQFYFEAFTMLSRSRAYTLGQPLPIPMSEILAVANAMELPGPLDEFITTIQRLDAHVLDQVDDGPNK